MYNYPLACNLVGQYENLWFHSIVVWYWSSFQPSWVNSIIPNNWLWTYVLPGLKPRTTLYVNNLFRNLLYFPLNALFYEIFGYKRHRNNVICCMKMHGLYYNTCSTDRKFHLGFCPTWNSIIKLTLYGCISRNVSKHRRWQV